MKLMKCLFCFAIIVSMPVNANKNYASNIYSPIPPGCATNWQVWSAYNPSDTQTIFEGTYPASETAGGTSHNMKIKVWRKGCPENDRSVIMLDISPQDDNDEVNECLITPLIDGKLPNGDIKHMRGTAEPDTYSQFESLSVICEGEASTWFIDTITPYDDRFAPEKVMTPEDYNSEWTFVLDDALTGRWQLSVPAYNGELAVSRMALTGRLSGTWVVPGVTDQGFVLAFQELTDTTQGVLFLSWYTYDSNGKLLWLTGAGFYSWGNTEVLMDIELVENGTFMGAEQADRSVIGTAKVVALNCSNLELTYDLNQLGLGAATKGLVRVFSIETQGYQCADLQTRILHENDG
jgi:hypothetical protein